MPDRYNVETDSQAGFLVLAPSDTPEWPIPELHGCKSLVYKLKGFFEARGFTPDTGIGDREASWLLFEDACFEPWRFKPALLTRIREAWLNGLGAISESYRTLEVGGTLMIVDSQSGTKVTSLTIKDVTRIPDYRA